MTNYYYIDFTNNYDPQHPMLKDVSDENKNIIKQKVDKLGTLRSFMKFNEIRTSVNTVEGDIFIISLTYVS